MGTVHDEIWEKLNFDLDAHPSILEVLIKFYGDIYLSQAKRLQGMEYFDFVLFVVHGMRIRELHDAKGQGEKVIGIFCIFVPEELVLAAGAIQVGLCAGAESEVVSLIGRGEDSRRVALGIHQAIVERASAMVRRVGRQPRFVFAGGVAYNPCMRQLLAQKLDIPLTVPESPQTLGALGAAIYAATTAQVSGRQSG
jgi:hypothetical protein